MSFLLSVLLLGQAAATPATPPAAQRPANATPAAPSTGAQRPANATPGNTTPAIVPPPADPASSQFTAPVGLLLVTIKPASVPDYELAIQTLQAALAKDATRKEAAASWRVFKAVETDPKANAVFVHLLMPAVPGFDYRPSLLIDELVKELPVDLFTKYQDAFAAPPTKLNLSEFAHMSVMPVIPEPPKAPEPPKKPGG